MKNARVSGKKTFLLSFLQTENPALNDLITTEYCITVLQ